MRPQIQTEKALRRSIGSSICCANPPSGCNYDDQLRRSPTWEGPCRRNPIKRTSLVHVDRMTIAVNKIVPWRNRGCMDSTWSALSSRASIICRSGVTFSWGYLAANRAQFRQRVMEQQRPRAKARSSLLREPRFWAIASRVSTPHRTQSLLCHLTQMR
jgi:hypothetical protein